LSPHISKSQKPSYAQRRTDHQSAQLSALKKLYGELTAGISISAAIETLLENVLQIFESDGAYLELECPAFSKKVHLCIGSCKGDGKIPLLFQPNRSCLVRKAVQRLGEETIGRRGWDPKTDCFLSVPISHAGTVGFVVLGKSNTPLFYNQQDLEELELFGNLLGLISSRWFAGEPPMKAIQRLRLRHLLERFEDGVYVIAPQRTIVAVSRRGMDLLGITKKEEALDGLYSDPSYLNVRSLDGFRLSSEQLPLRLILEGKTLSNAEFMFQRRGSPADIYLSVSGGPIRGKKGEVAEGILVARDITQCKMLEKERAKTVFFTYVSHELRTPLNAIVGYTSLLLNGTLGEVSSKVRGAMSRTHENAKILDQLIGDLLLLSKLETDKMDLSIEEVDLGALVRKVIEDARPLLAEKPVEVVMETDAVVPLIRSDPRKIRTVVTNLFSNAIKYTERGSIQARIKNIAKQRRIQIEIADTGIGIRKNDLYGLFNEFYRISNPSVQTVQGSGLGLAIVKKLLIILQGSIQVGSTYRQGSTFTIFLPYRLGGYRRFLSAKGKNVIQGQQRRGIKEPELNLPGLATRRRGTL